MSPTPTSYRASHEQIPRTVGKLRWLAVVPTEEDAPAACGVADGALRVTDWARYPIIGLDYLTRRKGYEIVRLDATAYASWLDATDNGAFLREVSSWLRDAAGDIRPGPLAAKLVSEVGARERVDGVLFFHRQDTCDRANVAIRAFLGVGTLGISEFLPDPQLQVLRPIYHVAIVESAGGRPVWRRTVNVLRKGMAEIFTLSKPRSDIEAIFQDLEPAVPAILTR